MIWGKATGVKEGIAGDIWRGDTETAGQNWKTSRGGEEKALKRKDLNVTKQICQGNLEGEDSF